MTVPAGKAGGSLTRVVPGQIRKKLCQLGDDLNSLASYLFNLAFGEGRIFVVNNSLNVKAAIEQMNSPLVSTCVPRPAPFGVVIHKAKQPKQIDQRLCEGNAPTCPYKSCYLLWLLPT